MIVQTPPVPDSEQGVMTEGSSFSLESSAFDTSTQQSGLQNAHRYNALFPPSHNLRNRCLREIGAFVAIAIISYFIYFIYRPEH